MSHSPASSSSLERLELCPGSLAQSFGIEGNTDASERGTRLHGYMEELFKTGTITGFISDDDVAVVTDTFDKLLGFIGDTFNRDGTTAGGGRWYSEVKVKVPSPNADEAGTLDLFIDYEDHGVLIDFKFGGHFVQHPKWNPQMRDYTVGCWDRFGRKPIDVAVIQPSAGDYALNGYTFDPTEYDALRETNYAIRHDAYSAKADALYPGPACTFCAAKNTCPARQLAFARMAKDSYIETFKSASAYERGEILKMAMVASANADAIKALAREELAAGGEVAGFKIVAAKNFHWSPELPESIRRLLESTSILTPAQAKKKLEKADYERVAEFIIEGPATIKLGEKK